MNSLLLVRLPVGLWAGLSLLLGCRSAVVRPRLVRRLALAILCICAILLPISVDIIASKTPPGHNALFLVLALLLGIRILWSPIASARSAFLFLAIADILSALWDALDSVDVPANAPLRSTALAVEFLGIAMSYEASPAHNTSPEAEPLLSDHPHHSEREKPIRSAETTASLWARLSFSWFNPVLLVGFKKPLAMDDLYDLLDSDKSAVCHARLVKLREGGLSLKAALFRLVRPLLVAQSAFAFLAALLSFSGPFFLNRIIRFVQEYSATSNMPEPVTGTNWGSPFLLVIGLFVSSVVRASADGQTYFLGRRMGTRIRAAVIGELYAKSLRRLLHSSSASDPAGAATPPSRGAHSGEIINLMSVDANKILEVSCYLMYVWTLPLQIFISVTFLLYVVGWPALAGIFVMVLMIPVGGAMGQAVAKKQKALMQSTDKRIHSTHELLNGIRLVKFYAWETNFLSKIDAARDFELSNLWSYIRTIALNRALWYATPILVSFLTFATLTFIAREELTPAKAFTGLALFNTLKSPLQVFPDIIVRIQEALVSLRRIDALLAETDLDDYRNLATASKDDDLLGLPTPSKFVYQESSTAFTLENVQVAFPSKALSVIIGPTGSGKSSLIMALLGELKCVMGGSNIKSQFSEIAYVPQQVWLMNATVRDNILFGLDYDQEKYQRVLRYCALEHDLLTLQSSDLTEVGEGGINLSGGQKARISLARATYSNASCVILDDVLSAVDAPTARHLFEQCICGPLMKDRTRILVTHAVSLCAPKASEVIVMTKGRIQTHGPGKNIMETAAASFKEQEPIALANSEEPFDSSASVSGGLLTQEESRSVGSVEGRIYLFYLQSAGGYWFIAALILAFLTSQLLVIGNDWWLKTWANAHLKKLLLSLDTEVYLVVYGILGTTTILVLFLRILLIATGSIRASMRLHHNLLRKIMFASVRFFETTPSGRIMNRFSKDMKDIDIEVATFSADFLANLTSGCATLALIIFVTPLTLFGIAPVAYAYFFIARKYLRTSRELKRLESVTRSPIFSHFGEALQGASTIRAYSSQERFLNENHARVDTNHRAFFFVWVANRWLALRVEMVGSLVAFSTAYSIVFLTKYNHGMDAGLAGLSLSYSLAFVEALLWIVRMHALMEMEMNAVERIDEYLHAEQEPASVVDSYRPHENWPNAGKIEVRNLFLRYSPSSPMILKDVSFSVDPGQKLGIVGRTGAGKTSLSLALFRFMEPVSGEIFIDGLDIQKLGLHDLRSGLTIIPQMPTLFMGTVRSNLDPFGVYTDHDMLVALRRSHLTEMLGRSRQSSADASAATTGQQITLDSVVEEGGSNFSQGQKQLLCLARAILKRSKIIVLDEATASVDHETDFKIQQTIREEFKGSTILCIAHRLRTVMDYERILVLNNGRVEEFGSPVDLIKARNTTGAFRQMCLESGEFDELFTIAETKVMTH